MAKERGIDLQAVNVQGSGTFGSIVSGDLDQAAMPLTQPSQVGDYEDVPHSQTRKVKQCLQLFMLVFGHFSDYCSTFV